MLDRTGAYVTAYVGPCREPRFVDAAATIVVTASRVELAGRVGVGERRDQQEQQSDRAAGRHA